MTAQQRAKAGYFLIEVGLIALLGKRLGIVIIQKNSLRLSCLTGDIITGSSGRIANCLQTKYCLLYSIDKIGN